MKRLGVVVDTSVIYTNRKVGNAGWNRFATYAKKWQIRVIIPAIVRYEVLDKFLVDQRETENKIVDLVKEIDKLPQFLSSLHIAGENLKKIDHQRARFDKDLANIDSYLTLLIPCDFEFAEYPPLNYETIVRRMFNRLRPFKPNTKCKDQGWRDALIWYTVLDLLKKDDVVDVILLSANTRDFAEQDKAESSNVAISPLHTDLLLDLEELGIHRSRVALCKTLDQFETHYAIAHMRSVLESWKRDFIKVPEQIGLNLHSEHPDVLYDAVIEAIPLLFSVPSDLSLFHIDIQEPTSVLLLDVYEVEKEKLLVRAYLHCELVYSFATYEFELLGQEEAAESFSEPPNVPFNHINTSWLQEGEACVTNVEEICIQISTIFDTSSETWELPKVDSVSRLIDGSLFLKRDKETEAISVWFLPRYLQTSVVQEFEVGEVKDLLKNIGRQDTEIPKKGTTLQMSMELPSAVIEKWKLLNKRDLKFCLSH